LALGHKETKIKYFRLLHIEAVAEQIVCAVVVVVAIVVVFYWSAYMCSFSYRVLAGTA